MPLFRVDEEQLKPVPRQISANPDQHADQAATWLASSRDGLKGLIGALRGRRCFGTPRGEKE